ncbi:MAG TPA: hypothetical protein VFL29_07555 [Candidatus Dormibacteraeota bacterium]|nr:hypothetical protein [Candidatus Dormibacteraeota bacterium]
MNVPNAVVPRAAPLARDATATSSATESTFGRRVRTIALVTALNVVAIAAYGWVAAQMGFFSHLSASLFWSPDSHTYREVADWLFGAGPNTLESQHRTFLYPLLLGITQRIGGDPAIWALNALCWVGMVNVTALAALRLTGRVIIAAAVFLVLATNASLVVLSMQALTETVTAFLLSVWILGLALSELPPARARDVAMLLLPISLLTVVRPQFEIQLAIAILLLAITIWRHRRGRAVLAAVAVACCLPVMFQVALNATANHTVAIARSGDVELRLYYVSQVYAIVNGLPDDLEAARIVVGPWSDAQALKYLVDHPGTSARTFTGNLHRDLTADSNFVDATQAPLLAGVIRNTNRLYLKIHAGFLPIVLLALWRRRDVRLLFLYLFAGSLTALAALIVDQGDRYIAVILPLLAVSYGLAVSDLLPDVSRLLLRLRPRTLAG